MANKFHYGPCMTDYDKSIKILETTVEMYENTLKEMKERGDDTKLVEDALEEAKSNLEIVKNHEDYNVDYEFTKEIGLIPTSVYPDNLLTTKPIAVDFLNNSRWIVKIGDFPEWLAVSFDAKGKNFYIEFRECDKFCAMEYFDEHKKFGTFKVIYLDQTGCTLRTDTYSGIKIKDVSVSSPMFYGNDDVLTTSIEGTFKKRTICLNR